MEQNVTDSNADIDAAFGDPKPAEVQPASEQRQQPPNAGEPKPDAQAQQPDPTNDVPEDLRDTPFKSHAELKKAYKEQQRLVSRKDKEVQDLKQAAQQFVRNQVAAEQGKPAKQVTQKEADAFLVKFIQDPNTTLQEKIDAIVESRVREALSPYEEKQRVEKVDKMITDFSAEHKGLINDADELAILRILDENPLLKKAPNPLKAAFNFLIAEDPEGWAKRISDRKAAAERDASEVKAAASGMGARRTSGTTQAKAKDEFDEVLEYASSRPSLR